MSVTKVAIVGLGTVGSGLAQILLEHRARVARHAGRDLQLAAVVVRDVQKARGISLPGGILSDDLRRITSDPEIRVVAQLIGGLEPARSIMLKLLESGKDVVTANKALLAEHGRELFEHARELGRCIAFESSVAGGIPIIANISQCLTANQITSFHGILNGTSNFIVSQMEEYGRDYHEALAEAQRLGYAEADPTMDVDGSDAAQKLAILAHLAFGAHANWSEIPRVGIESLNPIDLTCAKELGYRVKLLAVAQLNDDALELHVSPTLVKVGTPLSEVRGAYNAICVVGDVVGRVFYHGLGAGKMPTASAVAADMIDIAVGRMPITFRTLELWSPKAPRVSVSDHAGAKSRFYLRFVVRDCPGVLAEIAGVLGKNKVSVASVIQREAEVAADDSQGDSPAQYVSLVMMTHSATEGAADAAMTEIDRLDSVNGQSVRMPVLD